MTAKRSRVVGARELKNRLGAYLSEVKGGARLIVTERGRPVAEIQPIHRDEDPSEAHLADLEARGELTRSKGGALAPFRPVRIRGGSMSALIFEEREDRF